MSAACGLTVLRTIGKRAATKKFVWRPALDAWGKIAYAAGAVFRPEERVVHGLHDLAEQLQRISGDPTAFIVRGALAPWVSRRLEHDPDLLIRRQKLVKENQPNPSLVEVARAWLMIDIDDWPLRPSDDLAEDPGIAIDAAIFDLLPEPFHDAQCWWQLSSSAGFAAGTLKAHLFFWLSEPADNRHVSAVLKQHAPGVDRAPFNAAQPHYIAAPIIEGGPDPLPRRSGWRKGADAEVTLPELRPEEPRDRSSHAASSGGIGGDIDDALAMLGDGPGLDGFHAPLRLATMRYARLCAGSDQRDDDAFRDRLRDAIHAAPCRPYRSITDYLGTAYLQRSIDGAFALLEVPPPRPTSRSAAAPRQAARKLVTNLPAYWGPAPIDTRDAAKARQDSAMQAHLDQATRLEAARREVQRRRGQAMAAAGGEDALPPAQKATITRRIHRAVAAERGFGKKLPLPPIVMFSGAQGSGKTTLARNYIAATAQSPAVWWMTEPTADKVAEEFAAYLDDKTENKPPAMQIRGRNRPDPKRPGHQMCDRSATAERVAKAGLSVVKNLCMGCPLNGTCGDNRQRREAADLIAAGRGAVFFLPSEYAFVPAPVPMPDHAVLDESLLLQAVETFTLPLADIRALSIPNHSVEGVNINDTLREVCDALVVPWAKTPERVEFLLSIGIDPPVEPMPLAYLRHAGIGRKALRELTAALDAELDRLTPNLSGSMSDAEVAEALEAAKLGTLRQALALVGAVAREIGRKRDTLTGVTAREDGTVLISRRRPLLGMKGASLTVLDGTGDVNLSRKLYGQRLEQVHVPFPRLAHITATKGKGYSRQSIMGEDRYGNAIENRSGDAAKLRGEIAQIFEQLPAGSLTCANKQVINSLFDTGAVPSNGLAAWFSALRGLNTWEHAPGGLFVGAERLSIAGLEAIARAYLADDDEPFVSIDEPAPKDWGYRYWPYKATRMRRMRDGSLQPVEVEVHPDPRVQAVHEQIREAELVQAIDRLRSIWKPRQIILLNDLCLDVDYDTIRRHRDLVAGGNPIERAFLATGILPLSPGDLHRMHPTRFRTEKAAEHALRNYPLKPNMNPIWQAGVVSYRRVGQRGPEARVVIDQGRHPDQRAAALAALGPLQSFQGVACGPTGEKSRSAGTGGQRPISHANMLAGLRAGFLMLPPTPPARGPPDG